MPNRFGSSDEPFRPSRRKNENDITEDYLKHLEERGMDVEPWPNLGEFGIPDFAEKRKCMGINIFEIVHEAKRGLLSHDKLNELKGQIRKYINSGKYYGGVIEIYGDAREDLFDELDAFCNRFDSLPFGIKIHLHGDIV